MFFLRVFRARSRLGLGFQACAFLGRLDRRRRWSDRLWLGSRRRRGLFLRRGGRAAHTRRDDALTTRLCSFALCPIGVG